MNKEKLMELNERLDALKYALDDSHENEMKINRIVSDIEELTKELSLKEPE